MAAHKQTANIRIREYQYRENRGLTVPDIFHTLHIPETWTYFRQQTYLTNWKHQTFETFDILSLSCIGHYVTRIH